MSIVIRGAIRLDPSKLDQAREVLATMSAASEAEEGCHCYRFGFDVAEEGLCHLIEHWEDQAALDTHFGSAHMATFLEAMPGIVAGPAEILRYEVDSFGPM